MGYLRDVLLVFSRQSCHSGICHDLLRIKSDSKIDSILLTLVAQDHDVTQPEMVCCKRYDNAAVVAQVPHRWLVQSMHECQSMISVLPYKFVRITVSLKLSLDFENNLMIF